MKTSTFLAIASGMAATASPLLGLKVGNLNVGVANGNGLLNVNVASSSAAPAKAATTTTSSVVAATNTYPTGLPAFSAPVQGTGLLSLTNLPALPPVLDKTLSGVLGAVYGLLSGVCNTQFDCRITVAGSIQSLLVDGDNYTMESSIAAWCDQGRCYGSAEIPLTATAPFTITCDQITGTKACSATISGAANAIFTNGQQVELWGWLTPAGYCKEGVCTASISAFGDPMY
ncbi:hypothetical protein TW65_07486 [Stemphylium lycopersici]|uniref:p-type ATPase n=1 Tax=Stemphylium lycopersici TaxID=183478 RepID=A0A364NDV0_STELY|nr:hypothetical protein TW65_07486 [Stemphylium lycopersici]RAR15313.1 p-type ATPase [Stemphylium lycopersici]